MDRARVVAAAQTTRDDPAVHARTWANLRRLPSTLRHHHVDPGCLCSTWRNVILNLCNGALSQASLAAGRDAGDALEREYGPSLGVVTVVFPSMRLPSDDIRERAARDMEAYAFRIRGNATVLPGSGLRVSALRAAYATLNLFARSPAPSKVFSELEASADWMRGQLDWGADEREGLVAALRECEGMLGP